MKRPKVFFDADVLLAGSASTTGASHILLRLSELTLLEGVTSRQAVTEAERNLHEKLPRAVTVFQALVSAAVTVVSEPLPSELIAYAGQADPKDVGILAAACLQDADYLVTFNTKDYWPPENRIRVRKPRELLAQIRDQLASLPVSQQ